jgi:leucyl/phenylalanyl-tRNA--protein transferase
MIAAYCALNKTGNAHSVEVWMENKLVGGVYGVSIGRIFFGESMFSRVSNASKIALAHLARQLERWQFGMIDCQMNTPHLASLGAREIPRSEFIARLQELINCRTGQTLANRRRSLHELIERHSVIRAAFHT